MAEDAFRGRGEGVSRRARPGAIEIRLPDLPLWTPDAAIAAVQSVLDVAMPAALLLAAGYISEAAAERTDSGALAQSFLASPATQTGGIEVTGTLVRDDFSGRVFSSLPYAVVVNDGRRPGPISRAGIDAIGLWAQRKLGLSEAEADRAKWAIATEIRLRGTAGTDYFTRGVEAASPHIQQVFAGVSAQIVDVLTQGGGGVEA